jgi:hypothetical protein
MEQMNLSAPNGILVAGASQTSVLTAATNNRPGYGVLIPRACPPTATFPGTNIRNSLDSNDNNETHSGIDGKWSASIDFSIGIGNLHPTHQQTALTSMSFSHTQKDILLSGDSAYPQSETHVARDFPAPPNQQNKSISESDIDQLVDYNAYSQSANVKDGTSRCLLYVFHR